MWKKLGSVYKAEGNVGWSKSHAQVPVVDVLQDRLRVYYSTRDSGGISSISFVDLDKSDPGRVIYVHDKPIMENGQLGAFDDSGVMPTSIITKNDTKYLYYIGWMERKSVPYQNSIGIASSTDGITFKRVYYGPIVGVNQIEPFFSGTAYVMKDNHRYRMWYLSCNGWVQRTDEMEPIYDIKYSESSDGLNWDQSGNTAIHLEKNEGGLSSACVLKRNGVYHMWYSYRGKFDYRSKIESSYRIGYARSDDGHLWSRNDKINVPDVSDEGWDSEMIAYPYVIEIGNKLFMFYNGNGFGKSGFGIAEGNWIDLK